MQMLILIISLLINGIFLFLGFYVLLNDRKKNINRVFFWFTISMVLWIFSVVSRFNLSDPDLIVYSARLSYFFASFAAFAIGYFTFYFPFPYKKKWPMQVVFIFAVTFALLSFLTKKILFDVDIVDGAQKNVFGDLFFLYVAYYSVAIAWAALNLIIKKKVVNKKERSQINIILFGFTISAILSALTNLIIPYFSDSTFTEQFGPLTDIFFVLFASYAIVKHKFLDIKFVLRRSSVYLLSVSAVILLATGLKYIFSIIFSESGLLNELIIVFAAILSFPFIKDYFSYISNKYFFSSLYNTQEVITRFSERLSSILDIEKLLESVASEINKTFYPKSLAIFLFNEKDSKYYSAFSAGSSFSKRQVFDLSGNILNNYLGDGEILSLEEVKESSVDDFNLIQETFFNNDIKLAIPLSIKDRKIGLFLMGEKESGEAYNSEDIQLLQILSTQSAFALDNSLKYEEAKNFNILLEREVETAVMDLRKANEELRKLDTAKSDFISIASHQLRTPLTVIKGYISMILEGNFGKLPDTTRDPIEKIYDSNERLIKLVEQLLSISRIESGKIKYDFEEANLSTIINEVIESVRYSAIKKGLDLSYSPPKGFEPLALIDTAKIRQIITSLIDNSIKYTNKTEDKRGFILVRIEDLKEKDKIRVIVEDNGLGIRGEDQRNLFKKFSRGADMSIVHTEGTGLGLYVAKQIIEAHKGEIYAESRGRDLGAKIYFDLPKIIKEN